MKRGAWCAAVVIVALTGCRKQEAPAASTATAPAPTAPAAPAPVVLSAEALEQQPVLTSLEAALREPRKAGGWT